jgi:hypothetical protein
LWSWNTFKNQMRGWPLSFEARPNAVGRSSQPQAARLQARAVTRANPRDLGGIVDSLEKERRFRGGWRDLGKPLSKFAVANQASRGAAMEHPFDRIEHGVVDWPGYSHAKRAARGCKMYRDHPKLPDQSFGKHFQQSRVGRLFKGQNRASPLLGKSRQHLFFTDTTEHEQPLADPAALFVVLEFERPVQFRCRNVPSGKQKKSERDPMLTSREWPACEQTLRDPFGRPFAAQPTATPGVIDAHARLWSQTFDQQPFLTTADFCASWASETQAKLRGCASDAACERGRDFLSESHNTVGVARICVTRKP